MANAVENPQTNIFDDDERAINFLELVDGMAFPATKTEIVAYAEDQDASEEALEGFRALPGEEYSSLQQLNADIGKIEMLPGGRANLFSSEQSE